MPLDVFELARTGEANLPSPAVRNDGQPRPRKPRTKTILLISDDTRLHERLRCQANPAGVLVVRANGRAGLLSILRVVRPAAVLLDLDLSGQVAWKVAESILGEPDCPPLLLLTARRDQFDFETAIMAGALIDKSEEPSRLLAVVDQTLSLPESTRAERNAIQRVLIRWLKPTDWPLPLTPAYRFWGINE